MSEYDFLFWSSIEMVGVFIFVVAWFQVVYQAKYSNYRPGPKRSAKKR